MGKDEVKAIHGSFFNWGLKCWCYTFNLQLVKANWNKIKGFLKYDTKRFLIEWNNKEMEKEKKENKKIVHKSTNLEKNQSSIFTFFRKDTEA